MNKENSVKVLNLLLEINQERLASYASVLKEIEGMSLKTLFMEFSKTSELCKTELIDEIHKLNGTPIEPAMHAEILYASMPDIKKNLEKKDYGTIIELYEKIDSKFIERYYKTLMQNSEDISSEQRTVLCGQYYRLKENHKKIKNLCDALISGI